MFASIDRLERNLRRLDRWFPEPETELQRQFLSSQQSAERQAASSSLLDFIPVISRKFGSPVHMGPLAQLFERVRKGERVEAVVSTPPRHGKTETLLHGAAYLLYHDPTIQLAYIGYSSDFAHDKSRRARELTRMAGVELSPLAWSRKNWRTGQDEGGMWATSQEGGITGQGFHLMIVDDPVKDRAEAESPTARENTYSWFKGTAFDRIEPGGSCIVVQTRWHPDDLAGRLIADGWEYVNLQAVTEHEDGTRTALWPEQWPLSELDHKHETVGDYEWNSKYQGVPVGRGAAVFKEAQYYDKLPKTDLMRMCIGIDTAATAKTSADYSVAVVMGLLENTYYVLDVLRLQVEPREFRTRLRTLMHKWPKAFGRADPAATEVGGIEFIREIGLDVQIHKATKGKFTRAIPTAAAWNSGDIKVPRKAQWLDAFLAEVATFTGKDDRHDDQVDALASAYEGLRWSVIDWSELASVNAAMPKAMSWLED